MTTTGPTLDGERQDLIAALAAHRAFLLATVRDLDDARATQRTTPSELHLAGLIKHVAHSEEGWTRFIVEGPDALAMTPASFERHAASFRLHDGETLDDVMRRYAEVAARTEALIASLPSLDAAQPLPAAPWFEPGASWTARRVLLHVIAETAQHAGHADIIREALDGAKTMG